MLNAGTITYLLNIWGKGDSSALNKVIPMVYNKLYDLAKRTLQGEFYKNQKDLRTHDLIHEAYIALNQRKGEAFENRNDFFRLAASIMRTVLLVMARDRSRLKRGGGKELLQLSGDFQDDFSGDTLDDWIHVDTLLNQLGEIDKTCELVVELKYFVNFTNQDIAAALHISEATVKRKWHFARAWLYKKTGKAQ